jgi:hypothetical protein
VITIDSEHVHAQLHGWRTTCGGLILAQPISASVAYTPALAKQAPSSANHNTAAIPQQGPLPVTGKVSFKQI